MFSKTIVGAVSLLALVGLTPTRSLACSCAPYAILASVPAHGAQDVPTNVVLWVEGHAGTFTLTADDGTTVDLSVTELGYHPQVCGGMIRELTPATTLSPGTRYTLRAEAEEAWDEQTELSFVTGDGPLPETALQAPEASLVRVIDEAGGDSCGGQRQLCARASTSPGTMVVLRPSAAGDEPTWRTYFDSDEHLLYGGGGGGGSDSDCYSLERRDAAGRRSGKTQVCDVQWLHVRHDDIATVDGYTVDCDSAFAALEAGKGTSGPPDLDGGVGGRGGSQGEGGAEGGTGDAGGSGSDAGVDGTFADLGDDVDEGGCNAGGRPAQGSPALLLTMLAMSWLCIRGRRA